MAWHLNPHRFEPESIRSRPNGRDAACRQRPSRTHAAILLSFDISGECASNHRSKRTDSTTVAVIRNLPSTSLTTCPREFDFVTYEADGRFSFGEGRRVRLSFLIEPDMGMILQESPLSADQGPYRQSRPHFALIIPVPTATKSAAALMKAGS